MGTHSRAAIVSVGDELTLGQTLDTNSRWIAGRLLERGIVTLEHVTVADDAERTAGALLRLAAGVDVIVSTGGLGPTADDLTRQALAAAMGEPLEEDAAALEEIRRWFASRSRPMPETNRVQALRPRGAAMLANPNGTAPGLHGVVRAGGLDADVFCLPGPPREMMPMFEAQVLARLSPPPDRTVRTRVLHTLGLGESDLAERLGDLMDRGRNPLVGTTASRAVVSCRIRYEGADAGALEAVERVAAQVRERAGGYVFGEADETIQSAVLALLKARGATLATVESCTGGMLGAMLTEVPGSSAAYLGGWVTYANAIKVSQAGVPAALLGPEGPGAVSRETAEAMARGGLARAGAAYALSITGVAGPDGGTAEKPVGTVWIALAGPGGLMRSRHFRFRGERANIREWAARMALAMLRLELTGRPDSPLLGQVSG